MSPRWPVDRTAEPRRDKIPDEVYVTEKACSICKVVKPRTEFYRDKRTSTRLNCRCRTCCRAMCLKYRYDNLETVQAKHREYLKKNWARTTENLLRIKAKSPEKVRARYAVNNAIRAGKLVRLPCEKCGDPKSQGHHDDYSKPLEVHWMCHRCHMQEHRRTAEGIAATAAGL